MKKKTIIGFTITLVVIVAFIVGVIRLGTGRSEIKELQGVEVREYQGENLSSVNDFVENTIKGPQYIDINSYQLKITGLVQQPASYDYNKVIDSYDHYRKVVRLDCVEGWSVKILWEGVLIKDLLAQAKPLPEAQIVIFHAYDGYTTSFPLNYLISNNITMAYKMNDVTIPPERGYPFMLVAESKWGYKWVKWITEIELSDNIDYRGYWESRGYSNDADLNHNSFEY